MRDKYCFGCAYDVLSDNLFEMRRKVDRCSFCKRYCVVNLGGIKLKDLYESTSKVTSD